MSNRFCNMSCGKSNRSKRPAVKTAGRYSGTAIKKIQPETEQRKEFQQAEYTFAERTVFHCYPTACKATGHVFFDIITVDNTGKKQGGASHPIR